MSVSQDGAGDAATIIVSGSDAKYFHLARELIESIETCRRGAASIGMFDFGMTDEQRAWLGNRGIAVKRPEIGLVLPRPAETWPSGLSCLSRACLPENFPGYSMYIWLDTDVWLQSWTGIDVLTAAASERGAAMVRQDEQAYRFWPWLLAWQLKHFVLGCGPVTGAWLATRAHINAGVFAMRADAPHWACWRHRYQRAIERTGMPAPYDQFSLNAAVYLDRLATAFVPATCNWICDLATPMWNSQIPQFCVPYSPYTPIDILHLAGPAKTATVEIIATDGTSLLGGLRFSSRSVRKAGDAVMHEQVS